jgi:hypothetical protein
VNTVLGGGLEDFLCSIYCDDVLGLDIETFSEANPCDKEDCLDPRKGEIRLVNLHSEGGEMAIVDLWGELPSPETVLALAEHPLIIHHGAFEARWLAWKYGVIPQDIFCTLAAARLLSNGTEDDNDLGAVLARELGVKLAKDQGKSDWGSFLLTESVRFNMQPKTFFTCTNSRVSSSRSSRRQGSKLFVIWRWALSR